MSADINETIARINQLNDKIKIIAMAILVCPSAGSIIGTPMSNKSVNSVGYRDTSRYRQVFTSFGLSSTIPLIVA